MDMSPIKHAGYAALGGLTVGGAASVYLFANYSQKVAGRAYGYFSYMPAVISIR